MAASILWYDLETFGLDPRHDRIAQFACIRTDENLEEIEEPIMLYCKPSLDYLPSPAACKVHGITPQVAFELGLDEYDLSLRLLEEFSRPGTTVAGFNSVHFDDEFIRHLFYRNLFDPYAREYANGNSRWDIINLLRATQDLRPEGIVWPRDAEGKPIFKLEVLAKANGLVHDAAHDALSDIRATISLAKVVKSKQARLYGWYFSHRRRESLKPLIDLPARRMLLHTAAEYTSARGCTTLVAPVGIDPANRNLVIAIDLRFDPGELISLPAEEIRKRVFTKASELSQPRVPLSRILLNHCPFLAPVSTLTKEAELRLGVDKELCGEHLAFINGNPGLVQKLMAVFDEPMPPPASDDPELCLYSGGFTPNADRAKLAKFHEVLAARRKTSPDEVRASGIRAAKTQLQKMSFLDDRIPRLAGRLFARNFPETLSESERLKWRDFCAGRIQLPAREGAAELADYARLVETELADPELSAPKRAIVHALLAWKKHLEEEVLSWGGV
ncbi:MAG: exodeoxyribonuclease I [Rectinemataceae bacterium]|nr:exodeoxyribonuclease I [Rectinemataceae bacterium]